jgi:Holliday junction resolvase RusA-like endonuclease
VILDGLVKAGVLKTDDSVVEMHIYKERDASNPRTEILVTEAE